MAELVRRRGGTLALVLALALLAGCDAPYGIRRSAVIDELPSPECIEAALVSVDGVEEVRYALREGGRTWTLGGFRAPEQHHMFLFRARGVDAVFSMRVDHAGEISLDQSLIELNHRPPQADLDAIQPVMLQIEAAVERHCGLRGLTGRVEQRLFGVTLTSAD